MFNPEPNERQYRMFLIADYIARKMFIMVEWFYDVDIGEKPLNFQIFEYKLMDSKLWYEEDLIIHDDPHSNHKHSKWGHLAKPIKEYKSPIL